MTERFMILECNDGGRQFDQKYFIYQLPVHIFICQILNTCTYQTKKSQEGNRWYLKTSNLPNLGSEK